MESNNKKQKTALEANIFFVYLLEAANNMVEREQNIKGHNENKQTQAMMFFDLNTLVNIQEQHLKEFKKLSQELEEKGTMVNYASQFKLGKITHSKSKKIHLINRQKVNDFDNQIKTQYYSAYLKMIEFSRRYFDLGETKKNIILIKKLLYLIRNDNDIDDLQEFYIRSDGSPTTMAEMRELTEFEFEAFLLGIWHYLLKSERLQEKWSDQPPPVPSGYNDLNVKLNFSDIVLETKDATITEAESTESIDAQSNEHEQRKPSIYTKRKRVESTSSAPNSIREKTKRFRDDPLQDKSDSTVLFAPDNIEALLAEIDEGTDVIRILEEQDVRLTRGVFFYLMSRCIQTVHSKLNKNAVERLFLALLDLTFEQKRTIDFNDCHVRNCPNTFKYLKSFCAAECFDDAESIDTYMNRFHTDYDELLSRMIKISKRYLNSDDENEILTVALIEFIRNDNSIADDLGFSVCSDGSTLTKEQLCQIEEIEFEPFLLGIWHYVVSRGSTLDELEESTFNIVFHHTKIINHNSYERYRSGELIGKQSDMYVELVYLDN